MAKKVQIQLQAEVNTDEEWNAFLEKPGLLIIDIYSGWCGPVASYVGNLKKLRIDYGDAVQFAIAKNDEITVLERFRLKSIPTWMFIVNKKNINLIFGLYVPTLMSTMVKEVEMQLEVQGGKPDTRIGLEIDELTPPEQVIWDANEAIRLEKCKIAEEEDKQRKEERRIHVFSTIADSLFGLLPVVVWPQTTDLIPTLHAFWDAEKVTVAQTEKITIPIEVIDRWKQHAGFDVSDLAVDALLDGIAYILLMKPSYDPVKLREPLMKIVGRAIYGPSGLPPGDEESAAETFLHVRAYPQEIDVEEEEEDDEDEEGIERTPIEIVPEEQHEGPEEHEPEEIEGETIPGIWMPMDEMAKALVIHTVFPKVSTSFIPPEPEPAPPHYAVSFDATRRQEIWDVWNEEFPKEVITYGFFNHHLPGKGVLVAKNYKDFNRFAAQRYGEKLVLSVAAKRSYPLITLASLGPLYISDNPIDGDKDCHTFFPEGYKGGVEEVKAQEAA